MNFFSFNFPFFVLRPPPIRFLMVRPQCIHIGHQCNDQLTAVKTGYPLTSITWPYRGLRCRPIEVKYFFEVIRWQGTGFQMIAGSSLIFFKIHMKYVVFMCRTIKILISNWPRTRKFSQLLQAGKTVVFDFAHHGHELVTLYVQLLCSHWSKFDRGVYAENFDSWSWQSFVWTWIQGFSAY